MKRLFIALPIPDSIADTLDENIAVIKARLPFARFAPRENWHITMQFLGDQPENILQPIQRAIAKTAARCASPAITIRSLRYGPPGSSARMVWAVGSAAPLVSVRDMLIRLLNDEHLGLRLDERPLKLHVTLARFQKIMPVAQLPTLKESIDAQDTIPEILLMESRLMSWGSEYSCIAQADFTKQS